MMKRYYIETILILAVLAAAGCSTTTVRTTEYTQIEHQEPATLDEALLLDVGVGIFEPGVHELDTQQERVFPEVRKAEARYIPHLLARTLQSTESWGVIRVIPNRQSEMDLWVDGEILESDGERLKLKISVTDSSGAEWYTRHYEEVASKYAYDKQLNGSHDPFQGLYNRIANDMLAWRSKLSADEISRLRTITEMRFARRFSPEAFSDYLEQDSRGRYRIVRLPAENDPLMSRIRRIRDRDDMYVDTLHDYYGAFSDRMQDPYLHWRMESYREIQEIKQIEQSSRNRIVGGILAGLAGIAIGVAAGGSDNPVTQSAGRTAATVGVLAGGYMVVDGINRKKDAQLHIETLREISASLDAEMESHTITLEDKSVTLSGTVDEQYDQWRGILRDIYLTETGDLPAGGQN